MKEFQQRRFFFSKQLPPSVIILDPWLTLDTPDRLFFGTGVRAIDNTVETWCSFEKLTPTHATMALRGFKILMHSLEQVKSDKQSLKARRDCQIGAWLSVQGVAGGLDLGASHGIGHILGGSAGMPHGETSLRNASACLTYSSQSQQKDEVNLVNRLKEGGKSYMKQLVDWLVYLGYPLV